MDQRISLITLGVRDLDRARAFYDKLGWKRSVRAAEGVVFYQVGSTALALFPREDFAADAGVSDTGDGFVPVALAYNTRTAAEVDTVLAEAKAAGGTIVKAASEAFWGGYSGFFADPDGFLWEVAFNTGFAMTEDGAIELPD